jgi:hypothetical protein
VGLRAVMGRWGKSRPPPGFDPRTVQPVGSRYNDYATRPTAGRGTGTNSSIETGIGSVERRNITAE